MNGWKKAGAKAGIAVGGPIAKRGLGALWRKLFPKRAAKRALREQMKAKRRGEE